jgi:hypothetical protein
LTLIVFKDAPILRWKEQYRNLFLDEALALRGCGRFWLQDDRCVLCLDGEGRKAEFCCRDCFGNYPLCQDCALKEHEYKPLHVLEVRSNESGFVQCDINLQRWDVKKGYFEKITLEKLGIVIQLGHQPGTVCMNPKQFRSIFTVLSINGIHRVNLRFCNCRFTDATEQEKNLDYNRQLLEVGWWPSTNTEPQSAATTDLLRFFRLLNLNGAPAASEFYRSLEDLTDPEGLLDTKRKLDALGVDENVPVSVGFLVDYVNPKFLFHRSVCSSSWTWSGNIDTLKA